MSEVYVLSHAIGRSGETETHEYVIEDHAGQVLHTCTTPGQAIAWAKERGHRPLIACDEHRNDKNNPEHWHEG